jgi:hypothetical protein
MVESLGAGDLEERSPKKDLTGEVVGNVHLEVHSDAAKVNREVGDDADSSLDGAHAMTKGMHHSTENYLEDPRCIKVASFRAIDQAFPLQLT